MKHKNYLKRIVSIFLVMVTIFSTIFGMSEVKAAISPDNPPDDVEIKIVKADGLNYQQYHNGEKELLLDVKIHKISGEWGYCIAMWKHSNSGSGKKVNIKTYLPGNELVYACLAQKHIFEDEPSTKNLSKEEKYAYTQCMIWWIQRDHILDGGWRQFVVNGSLSESEQRTLFNKLEKQVEEEAPLYKGRGVAYRNVDVEDDQEIGIIFAPELKTGDLKLKKVSSQPQITNGNSCYSLEGAKYGVYSDVDCKKLVGTLVTDKNGNSNTLEIQAGDYWVKEIEASEGYELDEEKYPITVKVDETVKLPVSEVPTDDPATIELFKVDKDTGKAVPQGGASLAGAQFTINFYSGYYTKNNLPSEPTRVWVIETKEKTFSDGSKHYIAALDNNYKVSGDDFYYNNGLLTLPLGTIAVKETKEPVGYEKEGAYLQAEGSSEKIEGVYVSQIRKENDAVSLVGGNVYSVSDYVIRGGVRVQKRDLQSGDAHPEGGATLKGTEIDIISRNESAVVVDGKSYNKDEVVKTLVTDESGAAQTEADCLPYGDYQISEKTEPEGYLHKGILKRDFSIRENGVIVDLSGKDNSILNQVKRGDLEFVKIENSTHKRLAGIPFSITSKTTGESHIIVTDDNGYANTASDWNPHTQNTNRGEAAGDGIWFGLDAGGNNVEVDNTLGALPYDIYTIEEQPCKANEGKKLLESFEVNITRDNYKVNLGTLTNDDKSKVLISKVDATTGKQVEGATLELFKKEGEKWEKIAETVTTDKEWKFTAEPGEYKLVETMAPAGYLVAEAVTFTVADGEAVRRVEMKDEPIEISGNVDKKQTLANGKDKYFYTIDYCSTSNTWADELNLTDPLESVNEGYARLLGIQTPVSFDDYDGKMNVWYQTNKTDPKDVSDANAYNACGTNPENPANPDNERMTDYTGWKLWKEGVSTLEAENLKVSDLKLGEDEYVTAFRFEHGRVAEGFTTRKSKKSKLDAEKNEHDNLKDIAAPHESVFNLKDAENPELKKEQEIHYSPAVLEMEVISEDYRAGKAELVNSVQLNIFRNKGVTDKLMDEDEDRVVQEYPPKEEPDEPKEPEEPEEPGKPSAPSSPSRTPGIITTVQTGLAHYGGWFALAAAVLGGAAVMVWRRKNRTDHAEEKEEP